MQTSTLDKLKKLTSLYLQGYQSDVIDQTLEKVITLESTRMRRELESFLTDLRIFEQKYRMSSENFSARFHAGELGDDPDFFEWSALYDMTKTLREHLKNLGCEAK